MLGPWETEFVIFDLNMGFFVKKLIFSQLEKSRIPKFVQQE